MATMRAKYRGRCSTCRKGIDTGELIDWQRGRGARCWACVQARQDEFAARDGVDAAERAAERAAEGAAEREYQRGIGEGRRRSAERAMFGDAFAEQLALADEQAAYNAGLE